MTAEKHKGWRKMLVFFLSAAFLMSGMVGPSCAQGAAKDTVAKAKKLEISTKNREGGGRRTSRTL